MAFAIVPVREFENTKLRLNSFLDTRERAELSAALLSRVLSAIEHSHISQALVISSKPISTSQIARRFKRTRVLKESSYHGGVNLAMLDGIKALSEECNLVMLLPSDLPFIDSDALNNAIELAKKFDVIISPSKKLDGTNLLLFNPSKTRIPLHYDDNSFQQHTQEIQKRKLRYLVIKKKEFLLDLDSKTDLLRTMRMYNTSTVRELANKIARAKPGEVYARKFRILNCRILSRSGRWRLATLSIDSGRIASTTQQKKQSKIDVSLLDYDARGRIVLPGFIDSHCHLFSLGELEGEVKLFNSKSIAEMKNRIIEFASEKSIPTSAWILGRGWDQDLFKERRMPSKDDLDDLPFDNPIVMVRICGHIAAMNSKALEKFEKLGCFDTGDSSTVSKKPDGSLTGVIKETSLANCWKALPEPTIEDLQHSFLIAQDKALRYGLIGAHCILSENWKLEIDAIRILDKQGSIRLKLTLFLPIEAISFIEGMKSLERNKFLQGRRFVISGFKLYADGSLGARTAALREAYSDDEGNFGILNYEDSLVIDLAKRVKRLRLVLASHAIGDRAAEQVARCYSLAEIRKNDGFRIEHCSVLRRDLLASVRQSIISIQPMFATSDYWIHERLGKMEKRRFAYHFKTLRKTTTIVGGSDAPVEPLDPLKGIEAASNNKTNYRQSLSLVESIQLYTNDAAKISSLTRDSGSLEKNRMCDLIVLSCKSPSFIPRSKVRDVFIDGRKMLIPKSN